MIPYINFNDAADLTALKRMLQDTFNRLDLWAGVEAAVASSDWEVEGILPVNVALSRGVLVSALGDKVFRADASDASKPAMGVVTRVVGRTVYHSPLAVLRAVPVAGTGQYLYLGANGGMSFEEPASGLRQYVGYALRSTAAGFYDVVIHIYPPSVI